MSSKILDKIISIFSKTILIFYCSAAIFVISSLYYYQTQITVKQQELITPIVLNLKGKTITAEEKELFKKMNPFGFIIFPYNIESGQQTKALISELRAIFPNRKLHILVDQEGGRVDRLRKLATESEKKHLLKSASYYGEMALKDIEKAKQEIYQNSKNTAIKLKEIGFDINIAPMLDLIHQNFQNHSAQNVTWAATEDRSYSKDPEIVTTLAYEFIRGMHDGGMMVSIKHMPGLGRSYNDSHDTEAIIDTKLEILKNSDFIPFRKLAKISDFGMISHATYSDVDDKPASISSEIVKIIRNEFQFTGLIISDALNMKALEKISLTKRVQKSLEAGVDIVIPNYINYESPARVINAIKKQDLIEFNRKLELIENRKR